MRKNNGILCCHESKSPSIKPHHPLMRRWTANEGWMLREHCARRQPRKIRFKNERGAMKAVPRYLRRVRERLGRHPDACAAGRSSDIRPAPFMPPTISGREETHPAPRPWPCDRKTVQYTLAIASLYAVTVVGHRYRGGWPLPAPDAPCGRVLDRILDQIGQRSTPGSLIASHRDALYIAVKDIS